VIDDFARTLFSRTLQHASHLRVLLRDELAPTLRVAMPLVLAEIGWYSMTIVDSIMVGRLPNSAVALGAVSLGSSLFYTCAIFGGGLLLGLDTLVSQSFGRKDMQSANRALLHALYIVAVIAPLLMLIVGMWPMLMRKVGVAPVVLEEMDPFLRALKWSTLPLLLYFAFRRYLQGVHLVKPVAFALVSANIVNALGNWIFIYGRFGFRAYGVPGSGWSTCFARLYMAAVLLVAILYYNRKGRLQLAQTPTDFEPRLVRTLLGLGFPAASQILFEIGGFAAVSALCGKLGPVPLAAHQIALNCAAFTFMVPLGISSAAAVRVGREIGHGDRSRARRAGSTAILLAGAFMSCCGVLFVSFPRILSRVFTVDPVVISAASTLLLIAAAFQLFDGVQTVATGALRGLGETRIPMLANFVAYWLVGLPLGSVLGFTLGWGAPGLWIGLCLGLILVAVSLVWHWKRAI
jgi:multidrug resistance protein, MATE family